MVPLESNRFALYLYYLVDTNCLFVIRNLIFFKIFQISLDVFLKYNMDVIKRNNLAKINIY